jgi:hypothetical protein
MLLRILQWYSPMADDDPIAKLARQIDAAHRAERFLAGGEGIANLRIQGACELHRICADFTLSLNTKLSESLVELSPPTYSPAAFRGTGTNLIQIASQGRQIQIAFETPKKTVATEKFPAPYILEGEVRTYNQEMLERFEIRTRMLFFCIERETGVWRFFDWRTRSTGLFDRGVLARLMAPLL